MSNYITRFNIILLCDHKTDTLQHQFFALTSENDDSDSHIFMIPVLWFHNIPPNFIMTVKSITYSQWKRLYISSFIEFFFSSESNKNASPTYSEFIIVLSNSMIPLHRCASYNQISTELITNIKMQHKHKQNTAETPTTLKIYQTWEEAAQHLAVVVTSSQNAYTSSTSVRMLHRLSGRSRCVAWPSPAR